MRYLTSAFGMNPAARYEALAMYGPARYQRHRVAARLRETSLFSTGATRNSTAATPPPFDLPMMGTDDVIDDVAVVRAKASCQDVFG
jgi:hypothetical protein